MCEVCAGRCVVEGSFSKFCPVLLSTHNDNSKVALALWASVSMENMGLAELYSYRVLPTYMSSKPHL